MCGIVGYTGLRSAQPILLNSLAKLEYRGYDSCGIAVSSSSLAVHKDAVRVAELAHTMPSLSGTTGIGHTRWATHGAPNKINAHPHLDCSRRIAVVHNGIISNYTKLRQQLIREGHTFTSETDTEVIAHLIEKYYLDNPALEHGIGLQQAVEKTLKDLEGSYAIIVILDNGSDLIIARKDSPLIIGIGDRENFVASDVPAILDFTNRVIYLEDGDTGIISPDRIQIFQNSRLVNRQEQKVHWSAEQAQKGGYEHYMLKEIHEQPRVIRDTISEYLVSSDSKISLPQLKENPLNLLFLACGSSYHSSLIGKYFGENLLGMPIRAEIASEFNYYKHLPPASIGVGITQSGETADTLKAMKRFQTSGGKVIAITNVVGSTASKIADRTIFTRAGPEISVAATKSFMAQLIAIYWLILTGSPASTGTYHNLIMDLRQLPEKVHQVLNNEESFAAAGEIIGNSENVFYIGRGINYGIALEGALKLKEISYIHAEAYAAGEIKHGPFALLRRDTPVVAIVCRDNSHEAILTNIKEIRARGSPVFAIAEEGDDDIKDLADVILTVPQTEDIFSPFVNTVAVQLLAYYAAKKRGCSIDFPRNLAKSVTVE